MNKGFTLAELLIALAILGVIATFTIPKVLQTQTDTRNKAIAKETAAMVADAYNTYRAKNRVAATMRMGDLVPQFNYVSQDTISTVDGDGTLTPAVDCSNTAFYSCYKLHNGGTLVYYTALEFGGVTNQNALVFGIDPDGKTTGATPGAVPGQYFYLYRTGRVITCSTAFQEGAITSYGVAGGATDAPWFNWN